MKNQMMRPNQVNNVDLMNQSGMMGMASLIQKVGKGKRKYSVTISVKNKKMLKRIAVEMKKQLSGQFSGKGSGVTNFLNYLETEAQNKNKGLKLSFEELDFMKKTLTSSLKEMDKKKYKWYVFFKAIAMRLAKRQYKSLVDNFTK